jgi:hypothetical protein
MDTSSYGAATARKASTLVARIQRLAAEAGDRSASEGWATAEEFFRGLTGLINDLRVTLRLPNVAAIRVAPGWKATRPAIQAVVDAALADVDEAYARLGETKDEALRRTNRILAAFQSVESTVSKAGSVLASMSRLPAGNSYEIGDSFVDRTLVGYGTLAVNVAPGVVTLPLAAGTTIPPAKATFLPASNGGEVVGHELVNLLDGKSDTWFGYERSVAVDDGPLVLELLLKLPAVKVVNQLVLEPLTVDEYAYPALKGLWVSVDGLAFADVLGDIPDQLEPRDRDSLLTLGPNGDRNKSTVQVLFRPRAAQFVKVRFEQTKRSLDDFGCSVRRLALAELRVVAQAFADSGALASKTLPLPFAAKTVRVDPVVGEVDGMSTVAWDVSVDGGTTWTTVAPGVAADVADDDPSDGAIVRIRAVRNGDLYGGIARELASRIRSVRTVLAVGAVPYATALTDVPISGSLALCQPLYAVGGSGLRIGDGLQSSFVHALPAAIVPFSETVTAAGSEMRRVASFDDALGPDDPAYVADYANGRLLFGDNRRARIPGGEIRLALEPERVVLADNSPYVATLQYPHGGIADGVRVSWYDRVRRADAEALVPAGSGFKFSRAPLVETLDAAEPVPSGVSSFWLRSIPAAGADLSFTDTATFASRVSGTPTAAGEYKVEELASSAAWRPVKVTVAGTTAGGRVAYEAVARIKRVAFDYNGPAWEAALAADRDRTIELYVPEFGDGETFKREVAYVDGRSELKLPGDYAIDYRNGTVACQTMPSGLAGVTAAYSYQNRRNLSWRFGDGPADIVIDDGSQFVGWNDEAAAVVKTKTGPCHVVYKNGHHVLVPTDADSPFLEVDQATGGEAAIPFVEDDFLRGWTAPDGATRIELPHGSVVRGSLQFVFVSDDQGAFDDRTVTKDSAGNVVISPKYVRDVYGNALPGARAGVQTQRDVDRLAAKREVPFVDGTTELVRDGDYSVDYAAGVLYMSTPMPSYTILQFKYADVRVSYTACAQLVRDADFAFNPGSLAVTVNAVRRVADPVPSVVLSYDVVDELQDDPAQIRTYYSPYVMGYRLHVKG